MHRLFRQISRLRSNAFALSAILLTLFLPIQPAAAEGKTESLLPPPPYVTADGICITVGVKWDGAALGKFVPTPLKLSPDATGSITICNAKRGYVIAPISYADFDVDLANVSPADGSTFLWQPTSIAGAKPDLANTIREYYNEQVRQGEVRITETKTGYRATATLSGKEVIAIEVKVADKPCQPISTIISYLRVRQQTNEIQQIDFPVAPDICEATPVSAKVTPLNNDPLLTALQPKEMVFAVVGKNAVIGWGRPQTIGWSAPPAK